MKSLKKFFLYSFKFSKNYLNRISPKTHNKFAIEFNKNLSVEEQKIRAKKLGDKFIDDRLNMGPKKINISLFEELYHKWLHRASQLSNFKRFIITSFLTLILMTFYTKYIFFLYYSLVFIFTSYLIFGKGGLNLRQKLKSPFKKIFLRSNGRFINYYFY